MGLDFQRGIRLLIWGNVGWEGTQRTGAQSYKHVTLRWIYEHYSVWAWELSEPMGPSSTQFWPGSTQQWALNIEHSALARSSSEHWPSKNWQFSLTDHFMGLLHIAWEAFPFKEKHKHNWQSPFPSSCCNPLFLDHGLAEKSVQNAVSGFTQNSAKGQTWGGRGQSSVAIPGPHCSFRFSSFCSLTNWESSGLPPKSGVYWF